MCVKVDVCVGGGVDGCVDGMHAMDGSLLLDYYCTMGVFRGVVCGCVCGAHVLCELLQQHFLPSLYVRAPAQR